MDTPFEKQGETPYRLLEVTIPITIRTYQIDFAGIVSNTVYVQWLEDLRMKFLEEHFPLPLQLSAGYAPALIKTEIQYMKQLRLFDPVIGKAWLHHVTRTTWTIHNEILSNGEIVAVASQTGAFIRLESGRPIRVPLEWREKFTRAMTQAKS